MSRGGAGKGLLRAAFATALTAVALSAAPASQAAQPTGSIAGTVTDASTHRPIAAIQVCAYSAIKGTLSEGQARSEAPGAFGCAASNAAGEYEIADLNAGGVGFYVEFAPGFESSLGYQPSFYDGRATLAEATPVVVPSGGVASGIDGMLGSGSTGQSSAGGGAAGQGAQQPSGAPVALRGRLTLRSRRIAVGQGGTVALIYLSCAAGARCRGKLSIAVVRFVRLGHRRLKHSISLATAGYSLAGGAHASLKLRLTIIGGRILKRAAHRRLAAQLSIQPTGMAASGAQGVAVTLTQTQAVKRSA